MRVVVITLAFARQDIVVESISNFRHTFGPLDVPVTHFIVDQHYPINWEKDFYKPFAAHPDTVLLDPGLNLGLHGGHNWVINRLNLNEDDIVICYDSDSFVNKVGWGQAMINVMRDPRVGWSTLMHPNIKNHMMEKGYEELQINGVRCWKFPYTTMNSVCALKYGWVKKAGGMKEARPFYGHFESVMHDKMKKEKLWWVFLPDYDESTVLYEKHDNVYRIYKWRHALRNDYPGDFKSFLLDVKYTTAQEWESRPSYIKDPLLGMKP
jgi:hypothetical protein